MSLARETTLTFFVMYLSPLMSEVYLLGSLFSKLYANQIVMYFCIKCSIGTQGEVC